VKEIPVFYYILFFGALMSLVSLIGALTISITQKKLNKFLSLFIAMASGTLLGGAFFHMIPHALNKSINSLHIMLLTVIGFLFMYAFELLVHWHHCNHEQQNHTKPQGIMILIADAIHNFVGGIGIGAGFVVDVNLGDQYVVGCPFT
jgi:zinc and cadmium transporter